MEGLKLSSKFGKINSRFTPNNFGKSDLFKATLIASGGVSGGISSTIAGGKFSDGFKQGLITSGLNHAAHVFVEGGPGDPPKKITVEEALIRFRRGEGGIVDIDISSIDFSNADLTDPVKNKMGEVIAYRIRLDGDHRSNLNDGLVHGTILVERVRDNIFRAVYSIDLGCRCANYDFEQHNDQAWYSKRNLLTRYANFVHHFDSYNLRYYFNAKPFTIRYNGTFKIK
ncbi:hypothetical protein GO491_01155 [Flavobacteriaceae bacterium Ap0902]|nr:hypothetical protein [Flavobacteriaceae bacterium Ap0902]